MSAAPRMLGRQEVPRALGVAQALGHPVEVQLNTFLRAHEVVPTRAEALHGAARVCRIHGLYQRGYLLARRGIALSEPLSSLFMPQGVKDRHIPTCFAHWESTRHCGR